MAHNRLILRLFLLLVVLLWSGLIRAQEETPVFTPYSADPVVSHGPTGEWDGRFTDPGAVLYHDGQFHMLRNGFQAWPASVEIGYLTSPDGFTWTEAQDAPVMLTADVPYAGVAALASSALVEEDGTWVLYFYTWDDNSWPKSAGSIGRATAPEPTGPWTPDETLVLEPGGAGAWDDLQVAAPSVVRTDDGYVVYYTGTNADGDNQIGMAVSDDGMTWTKYDDPATSDAPFAESDPVLTPSGEDGAWDKLGVYQPNVQRTPDGWVMLYKAYGRVDRRSLPHGYATSEDGMVWTRSAANPVLSADAVSGGRGLWFTSLVYSDGTFYLFFELGKGGGTDIYLATYEGEL